MKWFRQHLNWTMAISWIGAALSIYGLILLSAFLFMVAGVAGIIPIIGIIAVIVFSWKVLFWAIDQKGRSRLWLLLYFVPLGFLGWLMLANNRTTDHDKAGGYF